MPDEGPALLVCNHVSYMDALILSSTIPRPIRFVMYYKIFKTPGAGWIFKAARAIPIAGAKEDPALMEKAFAEVDAALAEGELVCIFPEGTLTRDGQIAPFKSGRRAHPRPAPGAGGAVGAQGHVAEHVEPARLAPRPPAPAAAIVRERRSRGRHADSRRAGHRCIA